MHINRTLFVFLLVAVAILVMASPSMAQWSHSETYIGPGGTSFGYHSEGPDGYFGYRSSPYGGRLEIDSYGRGSSGFTLDFGGRGYGGYQPPVYYRPKIYLNW